MSLMRLTFKKRLAYALFLVAVIYAIAEAGVSSVAYFLWWDTGFFLCEESQKTFHFDAIRGYKLSPTPSRFMRISHGIVEYVGAWRGNSQGFPDREDFGPRREPTLARRIAVFGDSFTAAQYLDQNWPARVEDLTRTRGNPIRLLNFAIDGGGLANWWSVLTKIVDAEGYEIDGVIFAVYENNLHRTFLFGEHRGYRRHMLAYAASWDPETYPKTLEEARQRLSALDGYIVSSEEFEGALQGVWPPSVLRPFHWVFLARMEWLWQKLKSYGGNQLSGRLTSSVTGEQQRQRLIEDIRRVLDRRGIPVVVVFLPSKSRLLYPRLATPESFEDVKDFADMLGATFVDGREVFTDMSSKQIRTYYFPYDGHWNKAGSDRFAEFFVKHLEGFVDPMTPR